MNTTTIIGLGIGAFLYALISFEALLAYNANMFSPWQMRTHGHEQGIPWIGHFGASWGDIFIVTPLVCDMIATYGNQWNLSQHWILISVTTAISILFHLIWTENKLPDCLAWNGRLELAGYPHCLYMMIALPVIILFYFHTKHIDPVFLRKVSLLLGIHMFIGVHGVISLVKPKWWKINTLKDPVTIVTLILTWSLLAWRTFHSQ